MIFNVKPVEPSLLQIKNLAKLYQVGKKSLPAIQNLTLSIDKGKTLGIVGESGSGKSTLGKCLLRLIDPSSGSIVFDHQDITKLSQKEMRPLRRRMQMIFQDPYSSLNPRMNIESILGEGWKIHGIDWGKSTQEKIEHLLMEVGLEPRMRLRFPKEFSGGQRQRIGIARALALNPEFVVCDEPISSLDVYVQAQILDLLRDLKAKLKLTYLFISHDLTAVEFLADQVAVMYLGQIVEMGTSKELFNHPFHPYTQALISAASFPDQKKQSRIILQGDIPSPFDIPKGCPFHTRCPNAMAICKTVKPQSQHISPTHFALCHLKTS